ncbi:hypothetical protein [Vibrio rotiferianus]|uniref:hypothetical protein n=1 Tax=Vibrio rotiferianus TaxID=190895 RepID=UPI001485F60E|nr:hypothetical protein [Vibrio rotiferianus]
MKVKMRKIYVTEGDSSSKKGKVAYPKLVLCEKCVGEYIVISEGKRTYEACVKCGSNE